MNSYIKKITFCTAVLAGVTMSCQDSLLEKQSPTPLEEDYFVSELEFERAVWAIYAKMNAQYAWNGGGYGNDIGVAIWELPGDDATTTGNGPSVDFESFGSLQPSNGIVNRYYQAAYEMIGRANVLLEKNSTVAEGVYENAALKNHHRGEALFLRAYQYYNLWNFFGTPPLVTTRPTGASDTFLPPTEGTVLIDQAIADLEEAATLLPDAWDSNNRGRVTKNSAYGMLGKCLVFRGTITNSTADLTAALNAFDNVTGATLVAKFDDNHAADTENNSESLFEYQASQPSFDNIWLPDEFDNSVGTMSTASWVPFEGINSWGYGGVPFIATQKLLDAFEDGDPRLPLTLDPETRAIKKYVLRDQKNQVAASSVNNPRILRYADVLLLKAEAILRSGGSKAEAIGLINQVRARARNMVEGGTVPADLNSGEGDTNTIMQWIMDERLRELAFEESHRWFDIRRWHIGGILTLTPEFFDSENANFNLELPKHLYFPIPLNEIDRNPNMKQNSGY
jgi:tetratricopeptide (TPR) repeat protein